jgi:Domain of unknown function (DUF5666)
MLRMKRVLAVWLALAWWGIRANAASAHPTLARAGLPAIQQAASPAPVAKQVGVIKNIDGNSITLATDAGTNVVVQVVGNAKMVRVAPGQADLKTAAPIQLSDLHAGDRILVRGQPSSDGKSFVAAGVIAMSRSDVEAKHESEREDWQKRGIGGLVTSVDPRTGTISISVTAPGGKKSVAIRTTKSTILRRYAPDSTSFDEAKPAPLDQVKPGDQLRARGVHSDDGSEFAAEEIVSGSFRNIAGTISSIDSNTNTLTVMDLISKKPLVVSITAQSQLRRLPPEVAQRIAFRLKGVGAAAGGASQPGANSSAQPVAGGTAPRTEGAGARPGGGPGSGQADFQQIVNRMPAASLADFKNGDAVMIVATEGTASGRVTAITLLGGVEPILAASPAASQSVTLSPWSLGGAPLGGGEAP